MSPKWLDDRCLNGDACCGMQQALLSNALKMKRIGAISKREKMFGEKSFCPSSHCNTVNMSEKSITFA